MMSDLSQVSALPQTVTVGADYNNPVVKLTNADCSVCAVTMDRGIDFSGKELVIDTLFVTVRMNQVAAQSRIRVNGNALFDDKWELLRALSNIPKDRIIAGYADFYTSDGQLFLTLEGEVFQVPVTQTLDEFWESLLDGVSYGTPVWYEVNGHSYKFFWKNYRRTGKYEFVITAQSAVGLLDNPTDGDTGGLFAGDVTLKSRIEGIIGNLGHADTRLESVRVYGWQPVQSKRNALQDLIFAYGVIARRDGDGDLYFTLPNAEVTDIGEGRVFLGGSVEKNDDKKYTRVDVSEHTFLKTDNDKEVTLFDNTDGSGAAISQKVIFTQAPVYDLKADGLNVTESNCNYAIVSGVGKLTGKVYAHVTGTVSLEGVQNAYAENILSVTDAALVNYLNGAFVAKRIRDYYNASVTVNMDFIRKAENPGDLIHFTDPYGKERTGYLTAVKSRATSFDRASVKVVCGYAPSYFGNTYDAVIILESTEPRTPWTPPETLIGQTVRLVLIGGGNGGESGQHGTDERLVDGESVEISGCGHGAPGAGGRVYVTEMLINEGATYKYQCGLGGAGGVASDSYFPDENGRWTYGNNPGQSGGRTSFYTEFYKDGSPLRGFGTDNIHALPLEYGYLDITAGTYYALPGPDNGVDGGRATTGIPNDNHDAPDYESAQRNSVTLPWDNSQSWLSGAVGAGAHDRDNNPDGTIEDWAYGGLGGGAAVGADGESGGNARYTTRIDGGDGGNGANALPIFPDITYGSGGSGGHGGGEGGAGGAGNHAASYDDGGSAINGARGVGGNGSNGQNGADGCILIYYHT